MAFIAVSPIPHFTQHPQAADLLARLMTPPNFSLQECSCEKIKRSIIHTHSKRAVSICMFVYLGIWAIASLSICANGKLDICADKQSPKQALGGLNEYGTLDLHDYFFTQIHISTFDALRF